MEVSIFYKLEKTSSQTVRLIKMKTMVALLYLIMATTSSDFSCSFSVLSVYPVQK